MPEITYFDTLGNFSMGTEQLYWQGTADSLHRQGITVNNLNHPTLLIYSEHLKSRIISYICIFQIHRFVPGLTDTVNNM